MAEKRLSRDFKSKIFQLLDDPEEREVLFRALHDYQQVRSVRSLVSQLKEITTTPERLILYDEIRPFIVPKHQAEYDKIIPRPPSERSHIIRLVRNPGSEGLGFTFVGGLEFGVGIFVCDVFPRSQAEKKGLKVGDEIIRINGYSINQATNGEVLAAMKLHQTLMLKVKSVGMFPVKNSDFDEISWKLAAKKQNDRPAANTKKNYVEKDRKVFANLEPGMKLGCGIGTGSDGQPGIFVHKLSPGSMAQHLGFKVGDQVIDVNGESFLDITHSEAVVILKSSRQLTVTLRSKEYTSGAPPSIASNPTSFSGGSMGVGMGESRSSARSFDYDIEEKENQRRKEEMAQKEEETLGSVMMSGNWTYTPPPKPQEPEPEVEEEEEEEEQEEPVVLRKSAAANRFAAIAKEEEDRERERREKEGTYVPTTTDKNKWWYGNPSTLFTKRQIDNREMRKIEIPKVGSLDIELEGGFGTPLGGKLVVSEVFAGGAAARSGELNRGDQIMMVEGKTFIDINRQIAEKFLTTCMESSEGHGKLRMIIAVAPIKAYEDEVKFKSKYVIDWSYIQGPNCCPGSDSAVEDIPANDMFTRKETSTRGHIMKLYKK